MIADAESHRSEDARLREQVDARNELDSVAYLVERRLSELGSSVAEHDRARAEMLVADARQAVKEDAPIDRLRSLTGDLQQVYHSLSAAASSTSSSSGDTGGGSPQPSDPASGSDDDDVIDAEFTTS
jgi:molecular chaperone DnaK